MSMVRELVENERGHRPHNKEQLINLIATMIKTSNYLDWGNEVSIDECLKQANIFWDECYNEYISSNELDSIDDVYMSSDISDI